MENYRNSRYNGHGQEIIELQKWAFGLIVTVIIGFIAVYFK